ncbi:uncharacterized protein LOC144445954 [Glandiceps talaboti]
MTELMTTHVRTTEDIATDVTPGIIQTSGVSHRTPGMTSAIGMTSSYSTSILETEAPSDADDSCQELIIVAAVVGSLLVVTLICLAVVLYRWYRTRKKLSQQKTRELKRTGTYEDVFKSEDMDALSVQQSRLSYIQAAPTDGDLTPGGTAMSTFKVQNETKVSAFEPDRNSVENSPNGYRFTTENDGTVQNHYNHIDTKTKETIGNVDADVDGVLSKHEGHIVTADAQQEHKGSETDLTENGTKLKLDMPTDNNATAGTPLSAIAALDAVLAEFDFDFGENDEQL